MELLKKFFNGEVTLWKSYWLVFWLLGWLVFLAAIFLFKGNMVGILITLIWAAYTAIGVWRSSNNYQGKKVWSILAKIAVVSNTIGASNLMLYGFAPRGIY